MPAAIVWLGLPLLVAFPVPLAAVARLYHALCATLPVLAVPGRVVPPLALALLLALTAIALGAGLAAGGWQVVGTLRFARGLAPFAASAPPRLGAVARRLGLERRLTYLPQAAPAAFCYGLARPRLA